jgi:anti-sigma B factor antagonist
MTLAKFRVASRNVSCAPGALCVTVLDVHGRLTLGAGGDSLRELVLALLAQGRTQFLFNLGGVDFIDSYGVGELVRCHRAIQKVNGRLKLLGIHPRVQSLLEIAHLHAVFEMHSEELSAIRSFH